MVNDERTDTRLTGRYSRTIQIYLVCLIIFILTITLTDKNSLGWLTGVLIAEVVLLIMPMFWLYFKPIKVEARSGRLYIRDRGIDVTRRIRTVRRLGDEVASVRFNFLYQLNVRGPKEQIDDLLNQLATTLRD